MRKVLAGLLALGIALGFLSYLAITAAAEPVVERPSLLFVLLPMIDATGHSYGHESTQYLQAIVEADEQVGRLIDKLQELDMYDNTLIVILADHGMTGTDHGSRDPGDMTIPLIIAGPRVSAGELENAEIVDVAPTITALVGLRAPESAEGKDLFENMSVPLVPPPEYVVIVTLDGCRPDKLLEASTPNIDNLVVNAAYSWQAQTVYPSYTPQAHASLFTGAYPETHGYTGPGDTVEVETVFQVFEENGKRTALVDGKGGRIKGLEVGVTYVAMDVDYRWDAGDKGAMDRALSILEGRIEEERVELWVLIVVMAAMVICTAVVFIRKRRARVQPLEPLATNSPQ